MAFDAYTQNVTFLRADGTSKVLVPIPVINALHLRVATEAVVYASQLGACIILLIVVLLITPSSKLLRPSSVLHVLGLAIGAVRMALLSAYFFSPFLGFFEYWAWDFRSVAARYYKTSNASTVASFTLLLVTQAALMNQAWTMVCLWPRWAKWAVSVSSACITLLAVALKLVLTVAQVHAVSTTSPAVGMIWLSQASLVVITLSTCWFCAIFNSKLVHHVISNKGVLPSRRALTPVEVLIMANGILMIIPVVFTALQWTKNTIYEPGSFALTSVAVILPLGSLAAQRIAYAPQIDFNPSAGNGSGSYKRSRSDPSTSNSKSMTMTMSSDATPAVTACRDPVEMELRHLDDDETLPRRRF